jgi:hypothetical protein
MRLLFTAFLLISASLFLSCHTSHPAESTIQIPKPEIRLEFRGSLTKIPPGLVPPYQFRARAYSCQGWDENYSPRVALRDYPDCMSSFVEKIQEFETNEYKIDLDVPSNWSHAYIELINLESTRGMYSPGHNPNWFSFSKGEIITFQSDFIFRSQENPIPDKKQIELAEKFSPILIMDSKKIEIPTNLEKYHGRVEIDSIDSEQSELGRLRTRYELKKTPYMILPEVDEIPNYNRNLDPTHLYVHVRYAGTTVSGTQAESLPGYRDDRNYWYEAGDGRFVVSYWLWYDYNYGPSPYGNTHQGDLESYSVLCDANGNPLRIMMTGHDQILLDTEWKNINSINHHPILYVGSGRKSDGGNPTSAYGNNEVILDAKNIFFNWLAKPMDIFPDASGDVKIIIPKSIRSQQLTSVLIGANPVEGKYVDLSHKAFRSIEKLVLWEEPGWINKPATKDDPDGHHKVDANIAEILKFNGQLGKHPKTMIDSLRLTQFGKSPRNAPFKINIEQHYSYERPRIDRSYSGKMGNYGPKFVGDASTPQFTEIPRAKINKNN